MGSTLNLLGYKTKMVNTNPCLNLEYEFAGGSMKVVKETKTWMEIHLGFSRLQEAADFQTNIYLKRAVWYINTILSCYENWVLWSASGFEFMSLSQFVCEWQLFEKSVLKFELQNWLIFCIFSFLKKMLDFERL